MTLTQLTTGTMNLKGEFNMSSLLNNVAYLCWLGTVRDYLPSVNVKPYLAELHGLFTSGVSSLEAASTLADRLGVKVYISTGRDLDFRLWTDEVISKAKSWYRIDGVPEDKLAELYDEGLDPDSAVIALSDEFSRASHNERVS